MRLCFKWLWIRSQYQQHMCNNILMFATQGRCVWLNMSPMFSKSCNHQKGTERSCKRFYVCLYICMKVCMLVCRYILYACMYLCILKKPYLQRKRLWPRSLGDCLAHRMPVETAHICHLKDKKRNTEKNILCHKNNKSVFMWNVNVSHRVLR